MNLDNFRKKQANFRTWKNIAPLDKCLEAVKKLNLENIEINLADEIEILSKTKLEKDDYDIILTCAKALIPWRKGPFRVFDIFIDSEWQSFIKYNLIEKHFCLKDKIVGDIGCNNGYYLFKMQTHKPKRLVGFDPSAICNLQFEFINHFIKSDIIYERLGVEHLKYYEHKFDFLFMLGVLYHRSDPITTLKNINASLNKNGEILLDTFIIDGEEDICLSPKSRYSKIPNIYFIPTINALKAWLLRAGFDDIKVLAITKTNLNEQRSTAWSFEQSLEDFLDPKDLNKTVEGYPAPKRAYIKAKKAN